MFQASIDADAVNALRTATIDWRFKGMPADSFGRSVEDFLSQGPRLFESGFVGPLLTLDRQALEHNLSSMAAWCSRHGVFLAPHGKTTMAPQLFQRQIEHGAWGITAANLSQLRVYRAFAVSRILLANQLIDPHGLRWLAEELDHDSTFSFSCWADSVDGVHLMTEALTGVTRPVDVLVEFGGSPGRTGVRSLAQGLEVARAIDESPALRLAGVAGYEGAVVHGIGDDAIAAVDSYLAGLRELTGEIASAGYFSEIDKPIVTCGGSTYFDQVVEALSQQWPIPIIPVLRSGAYVTHDDGMYRTVSPFGRSHRLAGDEKAFRSAMRIWAEVTSHPEPDLALLTMGRRDASFDQHLPEPQVLRGRDGVVQALPADSYRITSMADQHAFLSTEAHSRPKVGDWIGLGLSHPCTVFDKWKLIPVVDGEDVVDLIRTYF